MSLILGENILVSIENINIMETNQNVQYQETNRMSVGRDICRKSEFGPNLGLNATNDTQEIFFSHRTTSSARYHNCLCYHNMQNQRNLVM